MGGLDCGAAKAVPFQNKAVRADYALIVFAFPFGVGALEVFYAVFLEIP
jgi:hypothetical protein